MSISGEVCEHNTRLHSTHMIRRMFSWHCLPPCVLPIESRDISERKKTGGRLVRVRAKSDISPIV